MASKSLKEKAIFIGIGVFVLYALTIGWWFLGAKDRVAAKKRYDNAKAAVLREKRTISEQDLWDERYNQEAALIPVVGEGQGADTVWMRVIGDLAASNHVFVSELKPGEEVLTGDMQETKVDIKWTGAVESLVKFMYELENTDKGKFDVHSLSFSPGKRQGFMSGNMTLTCIFKR